MNAVAKRRILYVNQYSAMGGGEYSLFYLLIEIDDSRFDPLIVLPADGLFKSKLEEIGVNVVLFPFHPVKLVKFLNPLILLRFVYEAWKLGRLMVNRKIELIHCTDLFTLLLVIPGSLFGGCSIVFNAIIFYNKCQLALLRFLSNTMMIQVVANSKKVKESLRSGRGYWKLNPDVAYNGVDSLKFRIHTESEKRALRKKHEVTPDKKVVAMASRFDVWKGHSTFLEAVSILKKEDRNDLSFHIIGDVTTGNVVRQVIDYHERILKKAEELQKRGLLKIWGNRDDLSTILPLCDVFVLPSDREPYGLTLLEAFSCGIPCVVSREVGALEVLGGEKSIFIFEPKDPTSLAQTILKALAFPVKKIRSEKLRELEWKNYSSKWESIYDSVLATKRHE